MKVELEFGARTMDTIITRTEAIVTMEGTNYKVNTKEIK